VRKVLWAVEVLALEVLLLWGYFAVVGDGRMATTNVVLALLAVTVSVAVWLGFDSGFGHTLKRLLLAVVGCIILTYAALVVAGPLWEVPVAVVCDRGGHNVEVSSTARGGYFEEHRVGPCVTYTHKVRAVAGVGD
jgi:predicted Co/Zn/Cd cation transporter (cation efflux family)